ncbi:MAG: hypothetical protein P9F19_01390 [Candidatus Contendobacter sp.]|nr:hypothetical protein [Candidatus Contendobacter sp.]MDG4556043.1 hypothetical protein [Candidatus Contendobacter sp.]
MNKLSLIFTALRAYKDARSKETSTLRGTITGLLAAGTIFSLGYMGADLSAEQIGLILAAITGIDSVLKIVLPDQLGAKNDGKKNDAQNIGHTDRAGADPDPARGADGLRNVQTRAEPGEDSDPATDARGNIWGPGGYNGA